MSEEQPEKLMPFEQVLKMGPLKFLPHNDKEWKQFQRWQNRFEMWNQYKKEN